MDVERSGEQKCHFCESKLYHLLRCSCCLHAGCLSCLANDDRKCNKCSGMGITKTSKIMTLEPNSSAVQMSNSENISMNCHFCDNEIHIPFPLICKTCKYIGCMNCLNDDCQCKVCGTTTLPSFMLKRCFGCDTIKAVNFDGFCEECIHQTALYHLNESTTTKEYTKFELESIIHNSTIDNSANKDSTPNKPDNKISNSNHVVVKNGKEKLAGSPELVRSQNPVFESNVGMARREIDELVRKLYPNLGREGPCKDCGEKTGRRIVIQTVLPDPYFLCMSCAKCGICGEKNRGRCWVWPSDRELVCGYCVCKISMEWDKPWNESIDKALHMSVIIDMYTEKTAKEEYDLMCKVRDGLRERVSK